MKEAATKDEHRDRRDIIAALEKALAEALKDSGYDVLNTVKCRKALDYKRWTKIRNAFADYFPNIKQPLCHKKAKA